MYVLKFLTYLWKRSFFGSDRKKGMVTLETKWQALIVICVGIFMSTLDGSILNIANPTIARSMSVSMQQVQWVVTAYMLVITATLLFFGKLGDQKGSSKIYTYGFLVFTIGSFLCSLASALQFLIAARIFQAIGASMMMATGIGIVSNAFPAKERGKALGITGSIVGIGNMTGPSLGGLLVAQFSWPVIFLLNIPIGLAGFILATRYLPVDSPTPGKAQFDLRGNLLFALAATLLLLGLSQSASINYNLFFLGIVFLLLFIMVERRHPYPLLDFHLFYIKNFTYGNIMSFLSYATQTAAIFLLPFYMDRLLHLSPATSGLIMTITPVSMALTAPLAGNLSDKIGAPRLTSGAFLLMSCGHIILSTLSANYDLSRIAAGLLLLGIGMGSFGSPNNSSILGSIPKEKAGYAGGFIATIRNFGFALGIAAAVSTFTLLFNHKTQNLPFALAYTGASAWVYRINAAICLLGLLLSVVSSQHRQPVQKSCQNFDQPQ
jgi:EmrB/QacA subfamily drug resistance transporter